MRFRRIIAASIFVTALLAAWGFWVRPERSDEYTGVEDVPARKVETEPLNPREGGARSTEGAVRTQLQVTFNKHIAPIIFENCSGCHRPNQSAPFNLLNYTEVRKHVTQIVEVTENRLMPPWLPVEEYGDFKDARVLSREEIALIKVWAEQGAEEGDKADLPREPVWDDAWHLGDPDVVVTMPEPYLLGPDGADVYRNFVIPTRETSIRFVRSAEIRPGNPKVVHHAVLQVDHTRASRSLDEQDPDPGFGGIMSIPEAHLPDGHFIGWTPGKLPNPGIGDLAWRLEPGDDLVLQLHMRPVGKSEPVQATVGLYFSERPPTSRPYALVLRSKLIDIPPGDSSYEVRSSYVLPVDVRVLSVYPHAHYLGKEIDASALLPDGIRKGLLRIEHWDFSWQDEYRYKTPVFLRKGTVVTMRHIFDNSSGNPRNPNDPPKRVGYGQNSTDEMAELMLQVLPASAADWEILRNDAAEHAIRDQIDLVERRLQSAPADHSQHIQAGLLYKRLSEPVSAMTHFERALELEPGSARAHFLLADLLAETGWFEEAQRHFEESDRLDPNQPETLDSLAQILARNSNAAPRDLDRAIRLALRATELSDFKNPAHLETVAIVYAGAGESAKAIEYSERAVRAANDAKAFELSAQIQRRLDSYRSKIAEIRKPTGTDR